MFQSAPSIVTSIMEENVDLRMPGPSRPKTGNLVRMANYSRQKLRPEEPRSLDFEVLILTFSLYSKDTIFKHSFDYNYINFNSYWFFYSLRRISSNQDFSAKTSGSVIGDIWCLPLTSNSTPSPGRRHGSSTGPSSS